MDLEILYIATTFCFAGFVKGMLGFGLPIITVSILSLLIPVEQALALIVFPVFVTSFSQAIQGNQIKIILSRFWPLILSLSLGLIISTHIIINIEDQSLYLLMGSVILFLLVVDSLKGHVDIPMKWERRISIPIGFISGIFTFYGPPIVLFLTALRLPKELFISVIGTIICCASIILAITYGSVNILNTDNFFWSLLAIIPSMIGLWLGSKLRNHISKTLFYRIILCCLSLIALSYISRGLS